MVIGVDSSHDGNLVKAYFPLEPDEDGWPPASAENLWVKPIGGDLYQIENTPFFIAGIAIEDIVRAALNGNGLLEIREIVSSSGNCTIRLVPLPDSPIPMSRQKILDMFSPLNVNGEGIEEFDLVALHVPVDADFTAVKKLLRQGSDEGWWDSEEGCISERWIGTLPEIRAD